MNKLVFATLILTLASCSPVSYLVDVETRQKTGSGMVLAGKSISVVYLVDGDSPDSLFSAGVASGFVERLEKEYFAGDSLISVYCQNKDPETDYSSSGPMVSLVMQTQSDVVFLFDVPEFGEPVLAPMEKTGKNADGQKYTAYADFPYSITLYAYDSMSGEDIVHKFADRSSAKSYTYAEGNESRSQLIYALKSSLYQDARQAGLRSAADFISGWSSESIPFYLYGSDKWYGTYFAATDYDWHSAIDLWMSMIDTKNMQKRACIEYNLAAAFYILGDYKLSAEWLELSVSDFDLPYSAGLRKKLEAK